MSGTDHAIPIRILLDQSPAVTRQRLRAARRQRRHQCIGEVAEALGIVALFVAGGLAMQRVFLLLIS